MRWTSIVATLALGCVGLRADTDPHGTPDQAASGPAGAPDEVEPAAPESPRLLAEAVPPDLVSSVDSWFAGHAGRRLHAQLDRPLYRPGETVWFKTWNLATRGLKGVDGDGLEVALLDPRGQVVETKRLLQQAGTATNDLVLPADAPGGRWALRLTAGTGEVEERPFVVSNYQAPAVKKELDFVREAWGAGDRVEALVELHLADGRPLADREVTAVLAVGGEVIAEERFRTDDTGAALVSGRLPATLTTSDGLLTVLVDHGGVTESISRSVPIVLADLDLRLFPEGGDLVTGLPGRVYFEANDRHGEPADVEGFVEDDRGRRVAELRSVHDGFGRFALTPEAGRTYRVRITSPAGLERPFPLPPALASGCSLRSYDDLHGALPVVRVGVRCTEPRDVVVMGVQHGEVLDTAAVRAGSAADTVVHLRPPEALALRQGAARVTVFDADRTPLAERLVYRNAGRDLKVSLTPGRSAYSPRDEVVLAVTTTDPAGRPVPAEVALAVVDDAVVGLADDEEGHLQTRIYLEPELVDSPEDPAWYFDADEPLAARGLDLVLGTRGWRRFEWRTVFDPAPPVTVASSQLVLGGAVPQGWPMPELPAAEPPTDAERSEAMVAPEPMPEVAMPVEVAGVDAPAKSEAARPMGQRAQRAPRAAEEKEAWDRNVERDMLDDFGYFEAEPDWAPVRVFPAPDHGTGFVAVRTDFRDTVFWEPSVRTDAQGRAEVRFVLSDAVTTFRVTAEGAVPGAVGHDEVTFASTLPVSVATRLPPAVSAGDRLWLPVTVTSTRPEPLSVAVGVSSGSPLVVVDEASARLEVGADASATRYVPLAVGAGAATVPLRVTAEGAGATDGLERELLVVPPGFPRAFSAAGELLGAAEHRFTIDDPVEGSLVGAIRFQPSPIASLLTGVDGLLQTPGGCFEQTSSTNWPNVAILKYLEAHDDEEPRLRAETGRALDVGYGILTGYQVDAGGFETWGDGPGKEALSAFGLLEFADMAKVYPVKPAVLSRDGDYLLAQRDGTGGFRNSGESAHGYGSAPKPVLDGFITWALVATGHADQLGRELDAQEEVAQASKDPYVLALAARSLLATRRAAGVAAVDRLARMQAEDGSFPGAESSITRSWESNLLVESTALATLALLEGGRVPAGDRGAAWLVANRQGVGTWGATQATALALEALTAHAEASRRPRSPGHLWVEAGGRTLVSLDYTAEQTAPLVLEGLASALHAGENTLVVHHDGGEPMPYTVDVRWVAVTPESEPGAEVSLTTTLDRSSVAMGETVRLRATLANRAGVVVPSPIARIGLPAGLEPQLWQLKELQDRGEIAFYETRPREVTLYWDGLHPKEDHAISLDLSAAIPGVFTGPASSAWPYYDDDEKAWAAGLQIEVLRP